jgi:hypothetical protein
MIPENDIPSLFDLTPKQGESEEDVEKRQRTGQHLKDIYEKKLFKETDQLATGPQKYFLRAAGVKMASDFLFASIRDPFCRMFWNFNLVVKLFLGIPVTPTQCFKGRCNGNQVHPHGAHAFHYPSTVTHRHHSVRDLVAKTFRMAQRTAGLGMDVHVEPVLSQYGIQQKVNAPDKSDARADLMIFYPNNSWRYWIDVTLTHPRPLGKGPDEDIREADDRKYDRYLLNYELNKNQVVPLVFTFTGGWSETTLNFLTNVFKRMVQNETDAKRREELFNKLFTRFRYQVSMAIVKALGSLLNRQIWSNYVPLHCSTGMTTTEMFAQLPPEIADPVDYGSEVNGVEEEQNAVGMNTPQLHPQLPAQLITQPQLPNQLSNNSKRKVRRKYLT